jgi:hypothetical protein
VSAPGQPATREDWQEKRRLQKARQMAANRHTYRQLEQAEVWSKQLTEDPNWNIFLQCLQALRNRTLQALEAARTADETSADFSSEGMARRTADRRALLGRIQTLDEVIALPRDVMEEGEIARELVAEIEKAGAEG